MNDFMKTDFPKIVQIATRAVALAAEQDVEYDLLTAEMDMESAHRQFGLDLDAMIEASDGNFAHDVFGIRRHIDRSAYPGNVKGGFRPRFARHS